MAKKKAAPEAPVTDERIQAELRALVELGKKKGFLTHDDILEQFGRAEGQRRGRGRGTRAGRRGDR